jgi:taurine transport system permease protein
MTEALRASTRRIGPPRWRSVLSIAGGLALWQLVSSLGFVPSYKLPAPGDIVHDLVDVALHGYGEASLWHSLLVSALRLLTGVALAGLIGVLIGYATGVSVIVKGLFDPIFEFFRCIPPLGILSLLVVWFGIGERSKVTMLMIAALTPVVLTTAHGIRAVRQERVQGARSLGLAGFGLFRVVILPSALPEILTGLRIGFGYAFGALVAAEMIGASSGLGWMVWNASQYGETGIVIVSIIVIGIAGFAVDTGLTALRDRLVPWAGRA